MADNTPTPKPPLPFSEITAEGPTTLFRDQEGTLFRRVSDTDFAAVTDITNLVGSRVFDKLSIRGEIGHPTSREADKVDNRVRQPWVMTCQKWIEDGRYIIAAVNPKDVQWRMPQRAVVQKTRVGEILHVWKDRFRNTFYDEPTIQITFQSGNIMPIRVNPFVDSGEKQVLGRIDKSPAGSIGRDVSSAVNTATGGLAEKAAQNVRAGLNAINDRAGKRGDSTLPQFEDDEVTRKKRKNDPEETEPLVPPGLDNFYEFIQLVDEQKILNNGDVNYVYIFYNSRIFPNLSLSGLFTPEGLSWTDSSDDPNQVNSWTANFTVYDSYPRLNDLEGLTSFFQSAGFGRV